MKRVTGIGGVFITSKDPKALVEWYQKHLGIDFGGQTYTVFNWKENDPKEDAMSVFSFFDENTTYLEPSTKPFMLNFRVEDLDALIPVLREEGVEVLNPENVVQEGVGKFNWILDPDGNKVELWEQA
ncbi:VOC family protein [bacterium]|nr:MAG: VOC family protein [bacterium]